MRSWDVRCWRHLGAPVYLPSPQQQPWLLPEPSAPSQEIPDQERPPPAVCQRQMQELQAQVEALVVSVEGLTDMVLIMAME